MATPTVYVICDQNCKFEGLTKEQILTAIAQAVSTGEIRNVDTGFVTTIKTINGLPLKFFVGEQSVYDALSEEEKTNLYAIITNDATLSGITEAIEKLQTDLKELKDGLLSGDIIAAEADHATEADYAATLKNNGLTFGRRLIAAPTLNTITNSVKSLDLSNYMGDKTLGEIFIVIEIGIYYNNNQLFGEHRLTFRTNPFKAGTEDVRFVQELDGVKYEFYAVGNTLYYVTDAPNLATYRVFLERIYEEF